MLYDTNLRPQRAKPTRRKIYLLKRANVEAIEKEVRNFSLTHQEGITDIDPCWEQLKNMLHTSNEDNVLSKLTATMESLPWKNITIKRAIRQKQRTHRKARATKKNLTKRDEDIYKILQQKRQSKLKTAHQEYMTDVVSLDQ